MNIFFFVFLFLSIAFLIPYFWMLRINAYQLKVTGKLLSLQEGTKTIKQQKSQMEFYYPIIEYEYSYNGHTYKGQTRTSDVKRLMVPVLDHLNEPAKDESFIWRQSKVGDELPVLIKENKPHQSIIGYPSNDIFVYQSKGFLVLSIAFFVLSIVSIIFSVFG